MTLPASLWLTPRLPRDSSSPCMGSDMTCRLTASPWGLWRWYCSDRKMADIARMEMSTAMHPHKTTCTPLMFPLRMTVKLGAEAASCAASGGASAEWFARVVPKCCAQEVRRCATASTARSPSSEIPAWVAADGARGVPSGASGPTLPPTREASCSKDSLASPSTALPSSMKDSLSGELVILTLVMWNGAVRPDTASISITHARMPV
mmetsp:Transcript_48785/g.126617  ORF Transcript_48785/g.126617 Transcript_48785/m.126617 type:complete len:207 (-) Transcript_48785:50-670(-)